MPIDHPHANRRNDVAPEDEIEPPKTYESIALDGAVIESFPIPGTKEAKGPSAPVMCEGEFESIKAINGVSPTLAPKPWAWGKYKNEDSYFMLTDFREVGQQPPDPAKFTERLAGMHKNSVSPTGKFGFHTTTCHGTITQVTDTWEQSWAVLYRKQLGHMFAMDLAKHGRWPEFEQLCDMTLNKVVPRLLEPLQSDGRSIKPCLLHGDCWDENTATDRATQEPFIFDAGSFYGHNEYDIGNWRALRHRLSEPRYVESYKKNFEPSEPKDDWNGRNLLYSLRFNTGTSILIDKCGQREAVFEGMKELCRMYFPDDGQMISQSLLRPAAGDSKPMDKDCDEKEDREEVLN
ncbi:hypothetical protein H109_04938 [Trichophyton interdigitale MR816]|uniref:protein-ribulosamine 3-kinase n=1 Tax=Trichophyton interdigitale (strain MR816) TaxID=1215338 RepID=A0A059J5J4_TRIIM|nr:hypothetical protein H109_04938 [Trichophyton interdigitale MR816]